jgi:hypothetical protein
MTQHDNQPEVTGSAIFRWALIAANIVAVIILIGAMDWRYSGPRFRLSGDAILLFPALLVGNCIMLFIARGDDSRPTLLTLWLRLRRKEIEERLKK